MLEQGYFHVLNRGNHRQMLFRQPEDFALFLELLALSVTKFDVQLWGYCLMGNHWHLVVSVKSVEELSRWMHWLCNRHVRQQHCQSAELGGGHIYQGRYKSFPVQDSAHLWTVLRYVEANPLRARLVARAEDWAWSSLCAQPIRDGLMEVPRPKLAPWPRDVKWHEAVNAPLEVARLDLLRRSVLSGSGPSLSELHTPTIAPVVPTKNKRWNGFSVTNATLMEEKLAYIKLNSQTACPPRTAVPVNQGCCGRFFHSQHPDRLWRFDLARFQGARFKATSKWVTFPYSSEHFDARSLLLQTSVFV